MGLALWYSVLSSCWESLTSHITRQVSTFATLIQFPTIAAQKAADVGSNTWESTATQAPKQSV